MSWLNVLLGESMMKSEITVCCHPYIKRFHLRPGHSLYWMRTLRLPRHRSTIVCHGNIFCGHTIISCYLRWAGANYFSANLLLLFVIDSGGTFNKSDPFCYVFYNVTMSAFNFYLPFVIYLRRSNTHLSDVCLLYFIR